MENEKSVKLLANFYQKRDMAKELFKDEYWEKLKPYSHLLKETMKANSMGKPTDALLLISKTNAYKDSAISQLLFICGTLELIEAI